MIYLNENVQNKIDKLKYEDLYIVADFDRTITLGSSTSSWSILSQSNLVPKEYVTERQSQFDYYRPIELDNNLDEETKSNYMSDWWVKHISLFVKYQMSEDVINNAAKDLRVMAFREGAHAFLSKMHLLNIPVIIISAGVGNFIEQFLIKNDCHFDNIHVISNFIEFEKGIASGVSKNIIHSLNKNEVSLPVYIANKIATRNKILLFGDQLSDIKMVSPDKRDNTIRIGFLEEMVDEQLEYFKDEFDLVCTNNTTFDEISKILNFK